MTFAYLRQTLEDIYNTTVQNEDELSYTSSTLLLASLLQLYARTPQFASYKSRVASFPDESQYIALDATKVSGPYPSELASSGYFYTGPRDETVCTACGLGLMNWQPSDQPEACHYNYSIFEVNHLSSENDQEKQPGFPCLYMAAHRFLSSDLPLKRKSLVPVGPVPLMCSLPGIIDRPSLPVAADEARRSKLEYASLADRLNAIVCMLQASAFPEGWPVENARLLGHSDDLIVLGLWRLQSESIGMGVKCPSMTKLQLDPHGTTDLLRTIMHIQDSLGEAQNVASTFRLGSVENVEFSDSSSDAGSTVEDAELATLSRCRPTTNSTVTNSRYELETKQVSLPRLALFLSWWHNKWSRP